MNIAQAVKKCAIEAVEASVPCDVIFGKVISGDPTAVKVGDMVIENELLEVCEGLLYREATVTFGGYERNIVINEGIKEGDTLVIVRKCGGESYVAVGKL